MRRDDDVAGGGTCVSLPGYSGAGLGFEYPDRMFVVGVTQQDIVDVVVYPVVRQACKITVIVCSFSKLQ